MYITLINMQYKLCIDIGSYFVQYMAAQQLTFSQYPVVVLVQFFSSGNAIESAMSNNSNNFHRKQ